VDLLLTGCVLLLGLSTALVAVDMDEPSEFAPSHWSHWLLIAAPVVPLMFRRSAPLVAAPVSAAGQMALWGSGIASAFVAPLVLIYVVSSGADPRGRKVGVVCATMLTGMALLGVIVAPEVTPDLLLYTFFACVIAYVLGTQSAARRVAEVELAEKLAVARTEAAAARASATADERQRIARDLHDIVGHSLSVIAVRAEAAGRVAEKNPNAAVDAVDAIATTARSSLADVRRVLAGMRTDEMDAELAPVPSLDSLPTLTSSFSDAGLAVSITDELPDELPVAATVGAGAYRIVQEALTNVLKHAGPTAAASLHLSTVDKSLQIRVEDDGRGIDPTTGDDLGSGIAGMRERAEVLGGDLEAGPRPGGGYRVVATLPVEVGA